MTACQLAAYLRRNDAQIAALQRESASLRARFHETRNEKLLYTICAVENEIAKLQEESEAVLRYEAGDTD